MSISNDMIDRRSFLFGTCALSAVGWQGALQASALPDYYLGLMDHVVSRVSGLAAGCEGGFWFITDLHIKHNNMQSGYLLAELARRTPLRTILCGGDLVEAYGKGYPSDRDAIRFAIDGYRSHWVAQIREAGGRLYTAKGNHDFTVRHSNTSSADGRRGFTLDGVEARKMIVDEFTESGIVTDDGNAEACYYYFDDAQARIRYVVADTTDSQRAGDVAWGLVCGMHERQVGWIAERALGSVPDGFDVVVMHHIPITSLVGEEKEVRTYALFRRLLETYQNRASIMIGGRSFDFRRAKGRILLDVSGHHHGEMVTYQRGILHVTLPCDAAYRDYVDRSKPWCGTLPKKIRGSAAEQTFDAIQFDRERNLVHLTRVGGGQDRTISLAQKVIKSGEHVQMSASRLKGPIRWGCYDADRLTVSRASSGSHGKTVAYHQTYAEISDAGVLTALAPGEVVVVAMDENYNREMFPAVIV